MTIDLAEFKLSRKNSNIASPAQQYNTVSNNNQQLLNTSLKGFILNTKIKKNSSLSEDFDRFSSCLLISDPTCCNKPQIKTKEENFDYKKAVKPLLIAAGITIGAAFLISECCKYFAVGLNKGNIKLPKKLLELNLPEDLIPGQLSTNINIVEEPQFAMYEFLRDPNSKKLGGLIGVSLFSAATVGAKNLVDGIKEVWVKKQNCDINKDLQKNLINVETDAFSGKLGVVNSLLNESKEYFKSIFSDTKKEISFKGSDSDSKEKKSDNNKNKQIKNALFLAGAVASFAGLTFLMFKNMQKTFVNFQEFEEKFKKELKNYDLSSLPKYQEKYGIQQALNKLKNVLIATNTKQDETIKTEVEKYFPNINSDKNIKFNMENFIKEVKSSQFFTDPDSMLYGTPGITQYYCYMNEDRAHLYNWIMHPENRFSKYLFLCFTTMTSMAYCAKSAANAVKEVIVAKENSKSELNLRKQLVEVEVENFKSKKQSAIKPLIESFKYYQNHGKSKEELKQMAENILLEIKNGPPYVYS